MFNVRVRRNILHRYSPSTPDPLHTSVDETQRPFRTGREGESLWEDGEGRNPGASTLVDVSTVRHRSSADPTYLPKELVGGTLVRLL